MPHPKAIFNDKSDPSYRFENQCVCYRRTCPTCGTRFSDTDMACSKCGAARTRCQNRAMENEEVCRSHAFGRPYTVYTKLVAQLADTSLEEFIERDERNLDQEFALAKVALSAYMEKGNISSEELMSMVKEFFTIAEKKKNIEKGQILNIKWDDKLANALRWKIKKLISTFAEIINEKIQDPTLKKEILVLVKERTRLMGNMITSPVQEGDYIPDVTSVDE